MNRNVKLNFIGENKGSYVSSHKINYLSLGIDTRNFDEDEKEIFGVTVFSSQWNFRMNQMVKNYNNYIVGSNNFGLFFIRNPEDEKSYQLSDNVLDYHVLLRDLWVNYESLWEDDFNKKTIPPISMKNNFPPASLKIKKPINKNNSFSFLKMKIDLMQSATGKEKLLVIFNHAFNEFNEKKGKNGMTLSNEQKIKFINFLLEPDGCLPLYNSISQSYKRSKILHEKVKEVMSNNYGTLMSDSSFIKNFMYGLTSLNENDLNSSEILSVCNALNGLNIEFSNTEPKTDYYDVLRDIYSYSLNDTGKLPNDFKRVLSCSAILSNSKTPQFVCLATMVGAIPNILEMQEDYINYAQKEYINNPTSELDNDINLISWKKPLFLCPDSQLSLIQNLASSVLLFTKEDELKDVCDRFNNLFENGGFLVPEDILKKDIEVQDVIKIDMEPIFSNLKEIDSKVEPVLLFNEVKKIIQEFIDVAMDMNRMDIKLNQDLNYLLNESFEKDYEVTGVFNVPKHLYFYVAKKTYSPESVIKAIDNNLNNFVENYYDIRLNLSEPSQTLQRFKSIESLKKLYAERFKRDVLEASLSLVDAPFEDDKDWATSFKI